jgi:hypothetical protein
MISKWSESDAKTVREMICSEDEFINHRLTWLVTLQGLLFAALGIAWEKPKFQFLIILLGIVGIVVSITSFFWPLAIPASDREIVDRMGH